MCLRRGLSLTGFSHGGGAVGVTLHMCFERVFLESTVKFSTYKFLRKRSVEAISVAAQMRARGSSVLSGLALYI